MDLSAIEEFDQEVNNRCYAIQAHAENLVNNMKCALDIALLSIPDIIKKMPIKRFIEEFGGDIEKACEYLTQKSGKVAGNNVTPMKKKGIPVKQVKKN